MVHDLLTDPILSWRDVRSGLHRATLPALLAHLAAGDVIDFPRARPHQFHPWSMFLTQLAAIALGRRGGSDPALSDDDWAALLLDLTDGRHEPWSLIVEDLSAPAFLQPPVPEGSLDGWHRCEQPDDVDVLVTTRNHDVKTGLISGTDVEAWVLALCTLQTTQGYPGRGYNGVSRMKGGYGNRARVGLAPDLSVGGRFTRDVKVLLDAVPVLVERGYAEQGIALAWLEPWDGRTSLSLSQLAPHFIEVCWRIRCHSRGAAIVSAYTTTASRRCVPEIDTGDVGDAWIPIERNGGALTVGPGGFEYQRLSTVLFERDYAPAPAQSVRPDDGDSLYFLAAALARGQGKTAGLHERVLHFSRLARLRLGEESSRSALGRRAMDRIEQVSRMRKHVLYPALKALAGSGNPYADNLHRAVDDVFFDHLFATIELDDEAARLGFEQTLAELARIELEAAIQHSGLPGSGKYRAVAAAEGLFGAGLRKHFPDVSRASTTSFVDQGESA